MHCTAELRGLLTAGALVVGCWVGVLPTDAAPFYHPSSPDPAVPTPESVLGYELGTRFTPHHRVIEYLRILAETSPRITFESYGETYEGRPLVLLTISSPENLEQRDAIRATYARILDTRETSEGEARSLTRDLPAAVWLSYNVHGDEASSSEAAMATAYYLAAARDDVTRALLESVIVVLDPCLNPDGRDRYVNWLNSVQGRVADPHHAAREHHQPWPGGRYNHYLFDLNRDWAWLSQRETRQRVQQYLQWMPQVHVDFHEMWYDATYFFFPPERPIHPNYPDQVAKWGTIYGRGNAQAFDTRGWRYYTAEAFDLYYPGYGDSWPTFQGAVGMTYEQAGHGFAGSSVLRASEGDTLTLADRAEHHFVASLSTLRTTAENREARLMDFHRFFELDRSHTPRSFLFPPGDDPPRTAEMIALIMAHGGEVHRTTQEIRPQGLHTYDGARASTSLPKGTYVVSMDQPRHRFLRTLLEPEAALPDTMFYDLSAWSLPLAFGVEAYVSDSAVREDVERVTEPPTLLGRVTNREAQYAFLISWNRNGAAKAAARLLSQGVKVHFTSREISLGGRAFPAGSLVIFRRGNPEDLGRRLEEVAFVASVDVLGVDSGLTQAGPDLGSSRLVRMREPRVAILGDEPASPTSVGATWFLLDQLYGIANSVIPMESISEQMLADYTVLVIPDSYGAGAYDGALDSATVEVIRAWVRRGGVLVGLGSGAFFATADHSGLTSVAMAPGADSGDELSSEEKEARDKKRRLETSVERERRDRLEVVPGTIFKVRVDPLHPLGFGYGTEAEVLLTSDQALELGPEGTNAAWFSSAPRVSGYVQRETEDRLVDRPFLVAEPLGKGTVVMYVEDPNFRSFWSGLTRLFLNSVFFLSGQDR